MEWWWRQAFCPGVIELSQHPLLPSCKIMQMLEFTYNLLKYANYLPAPLAHEKFPKRFHCKEQVAQAWFISQQSASPNMPAALFSPTESHLYSRLIRHHQKEASLVYQLHKMCNPRGFIGSHRDWRIFGRLAWLCIALLPSHSSLDIKKVRRSYWAGKQRVLKKIKILQHFFNWYGGD